MKSIARMNTEKLQNSLHQNARIVGTNKEEKKGSITVKEILLQ